LQKSLSLQSPLQERRPTVNRPTLRAVLFVAGAMLCAGLLAGCGDADDAPGSAAAAGTLKQTVAATSKLDSARLTASFELAPEGMLALGGPISLRASGPFAAGAKGELPRLELDVAGTLARNNLTARAISTGKQAFLRIDGRDYEIDQDFIDALRSHGTGTSKKRHAGLASLGLDPSAWIADPQDKGTAAVGGARTQRIAGTIDVKRLLDDVAKLLGGNDGLLTPKLRAQIESAVKTTKVDVWTGATDQILRQLVAVIDFAFKTGASPISGLDGGRITLRVRLDDVNATTVKPATPKHARPLSDLTGEGGLGALLSGLGTGILSGTGDGGEAFLECLSSAGGKTADIVECTSKLAP
jgi:hypothetical protein